MHQFVLAALHVRTAGGIADLETSGFQNKYGVVVVTCTAGLAVYVTLCICNYKSIRDSVV